MGTSHSTHKRKKIMQQIPSEIWFTTICYLIVGYVFGPLPSNIFFHVIVAYNFATKNSLAFYYK